SHQIFGWVLCHTILERYKAVLSYSSHKEHSFSIFMVLLTLKKFGAALFSALTRKGLRIGYSFTVLNYIYKRIQRIFWHNGLIICLNHLKSSITSTKTGYKNVC